MQNRSDDENSKNAVLTQTLAIYVLVPARERPNPEVQPRSRLHELFGKHPIFSQYQRCQHYWVEHDHSSSLAKMASRKALQKDVIVKLIVGAGQASPSPPVGPALGSKGVKSMDFCKVHSGHQPSTTQSYSSASFAYPR